MSKKSPTQRTLDECRKRGWVAGVVERRIPYKPISIDFLGCIDIIACVPGESRTCECSAYMDGECVCGAWSSAHGAIIGIQATSGSNHAARIAKAKEEPRLQHWLSVRNARFEVWSWSKRGARGKRKRWTLREEAVTL